MVILCIHSSNVFSANVIVSNHYEFGFKKRSESFIDIRFNSINLGDSQIQSYMARINRKMEEEIILNLSFIKKWGMNSELKGVRRL